MASSDCSVLTREAALPSAQGLGDGRLGKMRGQRAHLLVVERTLQLGQQAGEADRGVTAAERQSGEGAVLGRQGLSGRRLEERGDGFRVQLHRPAREVTLEVTVVFVPHIALRERAAAELRHQRDHAGAGPGNAAQRVAERGPHARRGIVHERCRQRDERGLVEVRGGRDAHGLMAEVGIGIGGECGEQRMKP
jgi:hypothetical protein